MGLLRVTGVGALAVLLIVGLLGFWSASAFADATMAEYGIAGPLSVDGGQTVRVAFFNVTSRQVLVVIALMDLNGTFLGGSKAEGELVDPGRGITLDVTLANPLVVIAALQASQPYSAGKLGVVPGATLEMITDGTSKLSLNFVHVGGTP